MRHFNSNRRFAQSGRAQGGQKTAGFKAAIGTADNMPKGTDRRARSYKANPVYSVTKMAKRIFSAYPTTEQNTVAKRASLNLAVGMSKKYSDSLRFWQDFRNEASILTDSIRFNDACKAWGLEPQNVAEHIVFEGKSTLNKVLKDGLISFGEKARMFVAPLYDDKYGLYEKVAKPIPAEVEPNEQGANA